MKKYILLSLFLCSVHPDRKHPIPQKPLIFEKDMSQEVDTQIVVSNVAGMLDGLAKIVPDPYNPVVVASSIAQIGISFAKIVGEMFKSLPDTRTSITEQQIQDFFIMLPQETQAQLISLVITYAQKQKTAFAMRAATV
jgi:hypothetical protein